MTWQEQAEELWGDEWKAILARMTEIDKRTMRRLANGQNAAPDALISLVQDTHAACWDIQFNTLDKLG